MSLSDAKRCSAISKRSGKPCQGVAMPNGKCRMHGGTALASALSGTFKTGRYSKYLPARLLERYDEAAADADLIALRDEIRLMDTRLADCLGKVDSGESGALWRLLQKQIANIRDALTNPKANLSEAMSAAETTVEQGLSDSFAWAEVYGLIETRRKLAETETKRLKDLQQMMTVEQAMALVAKLAAIVKENVTDDDAVNKITAELISTVAH